MHNRLSFEDVVNGNNADRNDPNDWISEIGNPKYIFNLLLSIINLSVQPVDIITLPKLKFLE